MKTKKQRQLDHAARVLLSMKATPTRERPFPTKADLNRKFRLVQEEDGHKVKEVID